MHVSSLYVHRFRGIRSIRVSGFRRVNLLLGRNNAGKTSVLESLFLVTGAGRPGRVETLGRMRGLSRGDEASYTGLFHRLSSNPFTIAVDQAESLEERHESMPSDLIVHGSLVGSDDPSQPSLFSDAAHLFSDPEAHLYSEEGKGYGVEFVVEGRLIGPDVARASYAWGYYERGSERRVYRGRPEIEIDPDLARFQRSAFVQANSVDVGLGQKISGLIVSKSIGRLTEVLNRVDDRIQGLALGERGQVYVDTGLPTLLPLGLMGEGVRRLISIVATLMGAEGSLVLVDEIDDGLHHSALALLWRAVLEAADQYDVQIVATTHSWETLKRLTDVLEEPGLRSFRNEVAAFDLVRSGEDDIKAFRYDFDQLDFALEHDLDVRS